MCSSRELRFVEVAAKRQMSVLRTEEGDVYILGELGDFNETTKPLLLPNSSVNDAFALFTVMPSTWKPYRIGINVFPFFH